MAAPASTPEQALATLFSLVRGGARRPEVEAHLVSHPSIDCGTQQLEGTTISHWAALLGQLENLQLFAEHKVSFDVPAANSGMLVLHWAATSGQVRVAQWLIEEQKLDINAVDVKGATPLMIATQYHHLALVEYLVGAGADASLCDRDGDSAMHWAAYKDNSKALRLLLYKVPPPMRVSPATPDSYGSTALHLAAAQGACKTLAVLVYHGDAPAALEAADGKGRTPLRVAIERGMHPTRRMLEAHAAGRPVDADDFSLVLPPVEVWWREALAQGSHALQELSHRIGLGPAAAATAPAPAAALPMEMEMKPVVEHGGEPV